MGIEPIKAYNELLKKLGKKNRSKLGDRLALILKNANQYRIKNQQNPDGSPFAPAKASSNKKGRIKKTAMFKKIRTARFFKTKKTASGVEIGFYGNTGRIAMEHQKGGNHKKGRYPPRQLLGITKKDEEKLEDYLIELLAGKK